MKSTGTARRTVGSALIAVVAAVLLVWAAVTGVTWWTIARDDPSRFEGRVAEIEQRYTDGHPTGEVLLTGSSTFEYWESSAADLAPLPTHNIGLRLTKIGDHLAHFERMVEPFRPRVLVVYLGSNDINGLPFSSRSAEQTVDLMTEYLELVRERLPDTRTYLVGIVETPERENVRTEVQEANRRLAGIAAAREDVAFIDTAGELLRPDGGIDDTLFVDDGLHFTEEGYEAFSAAVRAGLAEEFS